MTDNTSLPRRQVLISALAAALPIAAGTDAATETVAATAAAGYGRTAYGYRQ